MKKLIVVLLGAWLITEYGLYNTDSRVTLLKAEIADIKIEIEEYRELISSYEELTEVLQKYIGVLEERVTELEEIKLFTMEATAYTDDYESQGKWVGQTATGVKPQVGIVAVDPRVIPLGTKLYVEGYGEAIAADTGGAIKGNRIDVFLPTRSEAMRFGRKQVRVRIEK